MKTQTYIAVNNTQVIDQFNNGVAFAYQWSSTAGIVFCAGMMAISLIAWMIHRS